MFLSNKPDAKTPAPTRLRGAMVGTQITAADLEVLGRQWKANHIRWQLTWGSFPYSPANRADLKEYDAWLESALMALDKILPACRKAGLLVLIDLHTPPGGREEPALECRIFKEKHYQDAFLRVWEKIARRYRGNTTVWGYDLVNEPSEGTVPTGLMNWHALAARTAQTIRAVDPRPAIVVESAPWARPEAITNMKPLRLPNIVYSVHMYEPGEFTHQGVFGKPSGLHYPGAIEGKEWNKQALRQALQPVVDFQHRYHPPIYIGEFSAIRWAPGESAYFYLRDCIDIFEKQGWDWAYHAFREWHGWSVEHGADPKDETPSKTTSVRERLLRSWFARNRPPRF